MRNVIKSAIQKVSNVVSSKSPTGKAYSYDSLSHIGFGQSILNKMAEMGALMVGSKRTVKKYQPVSNFLMNSIRISRMDTYQEYLDCAYKNVWATFRALSLIGNVLVSTDFKVVKKKDPTNGIPDHMLNTLIERPNDYDTWEDMIMAFVFHLSCTGNAYWLKDEQDAKGRPHSLHTLLPQFVTVVADKKTRVSHYEYNVNGNVIIYKPDQIIHFRRSIGESLIMGTGDISPSRSLFKRYKASAQYEEKFLENGAVPSGFLAAEDLEADVEEWNEMTERFRTEYEGSRNAGKTIIMNGKWSYHRLGMSQQELEALSKERWNVETIFLAHGVPLSVAGIENTSNFSTSKTDNINFRKNTCVPLVNIFVSRLNHDLLPAYGSDVKMDYNMSGLVDIEQVVKEYTPLFDRGAISPNELREFCGLGRTSDPAHDDYYMTAQYVPFSLVGSSIDEAEIDSVVTGTIGANKPDDEEDDPDDIETNANAGKDKTGKRLYR